MKKWVREMGEVGNTAIPEPWDYNQWEAITQKGTNILVSAGAGAGKTAVLVERIIRRIVDPEDPLRVDNLLVVTFTEAAAAEMRERIAGALKERLRDDPGNHYLYRQFLTLESADISTIHSFCAKVVRKYFYLLGIDPQFDVLDEIQTQMLKEEVVDSLFERWYGDDIKGKKLASLREHYGGRDDSNLKEAVLRIYDLSRSQPFPEKWLNGIKKFYESPDPEFFTQEEIAEIVLQQVIIELAHGLELIIRAVKTASLPSGPAGYLDTLNDDMERLKRLLTLAQEGDFDGLFEGFLSIDFPQLKPQKRGEADEKLKKRVQELRQEAKNIVFSIRDRYFSRTPEEYADEMKELGCFAETLVELVMEFGRDFDSAKREMGCLDFSDLEHYCLKVLIKDEEGENPTPSEAAEEIRNHYEEVLVDEYQDTNSIQDFLLSLVSKPKNNNLFMVGDVKQSIYRFRLAEPELFLEKYSRYSDGQEEGRKIDLNFNYRSRKEIIDCVNFIFKQIMTPAVGEIKYDSSAELKCGMEYPAFELVESENSIEKRKTGEKKKARVLNEPVELHIIERRRDGDFSDDEEMQLWKNIEKEALVIGRRIKDLVEGEAYFVYDRGKKEYRRLSYKDIAVLIRAAKGKVPYMVDILRRMGIPVYADLDTGFFEAPEVKVILSLLEIIDNPRQDIPLAAVLRSPIVGLKAEDMAEIRLFKTQGDYIDAVRKAALHGEKELSSRLRDFLNHLEEWRTLARRGCLYDLILDIYRTTGYYEYVGGLPFGSQRQANLSFLLDQARSFENRFGQGLTGFLKHIRQIMLGTVDLGRARELGSEEDAVQVMSIHKSKGLEFPVVFIADLGSRLNQGNRILNDIIFHRKYGLGLMIVDPKRDYKYPSLIYSCIDFISKREELAEELRILYVAMTRAREKLILVGSAWDLEAKSRLWCDQIFCEDWELPDYFLAGAGSRLDWICAALARHKLGEPLRRCAGIEDFTSFAPVYNDSSKWQITLWDAEEGEELPDLGEETDGSFLKDFENLVQRVSETDINENLYEEINKIMDWKYPYKKLSEKAAKAAIRDLKHRFNVWEELDVEEVNLSPLVERPAFLGERKEASAAERGIAVHAVFQHLDLTKKLDSSGIALQIKEMVEEEILSPKEAALVNPDEIAAFFRTPLGKRLLTKAPFGVFREVPFTLGLPAEEVYSDLSKKESQGEKVVVQGVIDCVIEEEDGFILIDFKSDDVADPEKLKKKIDEYSVQLAFYAEALRSIWNKPVKEAYLYFLSVEKAVEIKV
ncbi:MAG TPA: helicase-exonuclease AddAB subunit AddA [Peptococcaceae bacterium]|nr:MAG: ATP-dependent helicase/nuclease subunit A [Clostridia bacterium 41_269]HBT20229.1 helicase-exonuclease AddAB subunit AddA [Peptococcaceae bacterium]